MPAPPDSSARVPATAGAVLDDQFEPGTADARQGIAPAKMW
jgi:hypothetical protein